MNNILISAQLIQKRLKRATSVQYVSNDGDDRIAGKNQNKTILFSCEELLHGSATS